MSLFTKAKKARENKKGFTLVELIVVLVILAILAAILVPALLGWIDEAKKKQYVLEARSVYMAMQAVADELYVSETTKMEIDDEIYKDGSGNITSRIKELSDVEVTAIDSVTPEKSGILPNATAAEKHQGYTIKELDITFTSQDGHEIHAILSSGTWEITDNGVSDGD